uniref:Uncharacterized protein n=1 Tax=Meloidogyne enterolobii TaxID=390850 RepID=A0A6V7XS55_MELEN|nr:unnamed protein product [Meloidogyne enterolobii]
MFHVLSNHMEHEITQDSHLLTHGYVLKNKDQRLEFLVKSLNMVTHKNAVQADAGEDGTLVVVAQAQ